MKKILISLLLSLNISLFAVSENDILGLWITEKGASGNPNNS